MSVLEYKQAKFDLLGITEPKKFTLPILNSPLPWLNMSIEKRRDVLHVINFAKSLVIVGLLYARLPSKLMLNKNYLVIADYSALRDYHKVLRYKLGRLVELLREDVHSFKYKIFVDAFPIYEKGYALSALGGTFGKNNLYQSFLGSKVVLGGFVSNLPIDKLRQLLEKLNIKHGLLYEDVLTKRARVFAGAKQYNKGKNLFRKVLVQNVCANCSSCFKSCPTGALQQGKPFNITKCISYLTVESRRKIPDFMQYRMHNWLFGCDVCQNVCPFNKKHQVLLTQEQLERRFGRVIPNIFYWRNLGRMSFNGFYAYFSGTPVIRMKYWRFKHRINWYIRNKINV